MGAPKGSGSKFTQELADEICERISKGEPLAVIARDEHMPTEDCIHKWKVLHPAFGIAIAGAREKGFDAIAQDAMDIADATNNDSIETERGSIPNGEWIARSRLRVETRLKLLAKWCPAKYGDAVKVEHSGQIDSKVTMTEERRLELIEKRRRARAGTGEIHGVQ